MYWMEEEKSRTTRVFGVNNYMISDFIYCAGENCRNRSHKPKSYFESVMFKMIFICS